MLIQDLVFLLGRYFPLYVFWLALPWLLPVCFLCFTPSFLPCIWSTHWTHLLFYFCHPTLSFVLHFVSTFISRPVLPFSLPLIDLALPFALLTCPSLWPYLSHSFLYSHPLFLCHTPLLSFCLCVSFFFACYLNYSLDYCLSFELFPNLFSFIFSSCIVSCIALS